VLLVNITALRSQQVLRRNWCPIPRESTVSRRCVGALVAAANVAVYVGTLATFVVTCVSAAAYAGVQQSDMRNQQQSLLGLVAVCAGAGALLVAHAAVKGLLFVIVRRTGCSEQEARYALLERCSCLARLSWCRTSFSACFLRALCRCRCCTLCCRRSRRCARCCRRCCGRGTPLLFGAGGSLGSSGFMAGSHPSVGGGGSAGGSASGASGALVGSAYVVDGSGAVGVGGGRRSPYMGAASAYVGHARSYGSTGVSAVGELGARPFRESVAHYFPVTDDGSGSDSDWSADGTSAATPRVLESELAGASATAAVGPWSKRGGGAGASAGGRLRAASDADGSDAFDAPDIVVALSIQDLVDRRKQRCDRVFLWPLRVLGLAVAAQAATALVIAVVVGVEPHT
jgi:hypothetical protein